MAVTFGGYQCHDPVFFREDCIRERFPTGWYGKPNAFFCPLGVHPGQGFLLLPRKSLDALGLNTAADLLFKNTQTQSITLKNLIIVRATSLQSAARDDERSVYLVEIADRRRLWSAVPINLAYNIRSTPGSATYFSATLNTGVAWTWTGMVQSIWDTVGQLGTYPGLPFTPDGTPDGWNFYGGYAMAALESVLTRIGCALKLDPTTEAYSIVRIATDATATTALTKYDVPPYRIWDTEPQEPALGRIPQYCRVQFRKQRLTPDTTGASNWYLVDVADPSGTSTGVQTGTYGIVIDDLPALYDATGTLSNAAALATRAAERAADYFRIFRINRLNRVYSGSIDAAGLRPAGRIKGTLWGDRGDGYTTSVVYHPGLVGDITATTGTAWPDVEVINNQEWIWGGDNNSQQINFAVLVDLLYYYLASFSWIFLSAVEFCHYICWCVATDTLDSLSYNNYEPDTNPKKPWWRLNVTFATGAQVTGIVAPTEDDPDGCELVITNVGNQDLIILHDSASSTAANRIYTPDGDTWYVAPSHTIWLRYDSSVSRWRILYCFPPVFTGATTIADGAEGIVPAPVIAERLKFLRGDATWALPATMVGATTIANGVAGFVPAPVIAERLKFLRGDATWVADPTPAFSGAKVYQTADFTLSAGTDTVVEFDQDSYDTDTYFDGTSKLTAPVAGFYRVGASLGIYGGDPYAGTGPTPAAAVTAAIIIGNLGADYEVWSHHADDSAEGLTFAAVCLNAEVHLNAAEYCQLVAFSLLDGYVMGETDSGVPCKFWMSLIKAD